MALEDAKKIFIESANLLGDYALLSTTQLANGYCDAEEAGDELKRSAYYSALMLRYWYKIYEWQKTCASLKLELDDFVYWIYESLDWAFRYRRWRDPSNDLYNDPNGPDKVFKRCLFSTRGRHYQESNKDCRKTNYLTDSFEAGQEALGDSYDVGAVEGEVEDYKNRDLIKLLLKQNKFIDALVIDGIMYQDCFNMDKTDACMRVYNEETDEFEQVEYDKYSHTFNIKKLVKHLRNVDGNFMSQFIKTYDLNQEEGNKILAEVTKKNGTTLKRYVEKTLYNLRKDEQLLSSLINVAY